MSPTSLGEGDGLPATLETGDVAPFVEELRAKYDRVAGVKRKIQSQVTSYETPLGPLVVGDAVRSETPVEEVRESIVQLPF